MTMPDRRGMTDISRYLRIFLISVIIIPMLMAGVLGWLEYSASFRDAYDRVWRAADAVQQYTLKVFETDELILGQISEHVAGQDWSELVRSAEFHRYLQQFSRPQISSVGLIARD